MAVRFFKKANIGLRLYPHVGDVTRRDGTVLQDAQSRHATVGIEVTEEMLDTLKFVGLSSTATLGSYLDLKLIIGFPSGAGMGPTEGYLDARFADPKLLISHPPASGVDTQISVTIHSIRMKHPSRNFVPAGSPYSFSIILSVAHENHGLKVTADCDGGDWNPGLWTAQYYEWSVLCSAKLIFSGCPSLDSFSVDSSSSDHLAFLRKMLNEELYCDVVVITANKAEVKFHRSVMAGHSSVFNTMFQSCMTEAQTGVVEMPDMTEEGVRALREYLYLGKLDGPMENALVCCELLEAGHKYDIPVLEKKMEKIILQKGLEGYPVDVALRLFLFVRGRGEEGLEMTKKAVRVLKSKHEELLVLPSYQELFEKNIDAVRDLCDSLVKYSN